MYLRPVTSHVSLVTKNMITITKSNTLEVRDLGTMDYREALEVQKDVLEKRIKGKAPDTLILVEHYPVVTLGRLSEKSEIIDKDFFDREGISLVNTGRGGRATYHAPGQLVVYPVIDLAGKKKDISFYIDFLEKTVVNSLARLGVPAERNTEKRGVWVRGRKTAFTGIAVKKWVTYHGVSVNLNNEVDAFARITPCGDAGIKVISAKQVLGRDVDMSEARKVFAEQFARDLEAEYGIN